MDVKFEGPRHYLASAAVSILGTTSAAISGPEQLEKLKVCGRQIPEMGL